MRDPNAHSAPAERREQAYVNRLVNQFVWREDPEAVLDSDGELVRVLRTLHGDWRARITVEAESREVLLYVSHSHYEDPCWLGTHPFRTVAEAAEAFAWTILETEQDSLDPEPIPHNTVELRVTHMSDPTRNIRTRIAPGHKAFERVLEVAKREGLVVRIEDSSMISSDGNLFSIREDASGLRFAHREYTFLMFDHTHPLWAEWPR